MNKPKSLFCPLCSSTKLVMLQTAITSTPIFLGGNHKAVIDDDNLEVIDFEPSATIQCNHCFETSDTNKSLNVWARDLDLI